MSIQVICPCWDARKQPLQPLFSPEKPCVDEAALLLAREAFNVSYRNPSPLEQFRSSMNRIYKRAEKIGREFSLSHQFIVEAATLASLRILKSPLIGVHSASLGRVSPDDYAKPSDFPGLSSSLPTAKKNKLENPSPSGNKKQKTNNPLSLDTIFLPEPSAAPPQIPPNIFKDGKEKCFLIYESVKS